MENNIHKQVKECDVNEPVSHCGQPVALDIKRSSLKNSSMLFLLLLLLSFSFTATRLRSYVLPSNRLESGEHAEASRRAQTHVGDGIFWCDRSDHRTDVCYMRGDVHLVPGNVTSLVLYSPSAEPFFEGEEIIRPYPRKWDNLTLQNVTQLVLRNERVVIDNHSIRDHNVYCEVVHSRPLLVFSIGGFTGNPYHDFNDVIIPVFISSRQYRGEVIFGMVDVQDWWLEKFRAIFKLLTKHKIIDIDRTDQIHCFRDAFVGLRVHAELGIFPSQTTQNETIKDFQKLLHQAYGRSNSAEALANVSSDCKIKQVGNKIHCHRLKLVLFARKRSRMILNQEQVVKLARGEGFEVQVLEPSVDTDLASMYRSLHDADVMIGVHGAALTHILFMRARSVFIQIVPLGTDWPARTYYQEPAENGLDLQYLEYRISPEESTLIRSYSADNLVVTDPEAVVQNNWEARKKIYMEAQDVRLSAPKVLSTLREAKRLALRAFPERR